MAEITLGNKTKVDVLTVNIGEGSYNIPLAGAIPYAKLKALKNDEAIYDFLCEYIPVEVAELLTIDDIKAIFSAWSEATQKAEGVSLGE